MSRAEEKAKSYCKEKGYKSEWIKPYLAYIEGYEQAEKDLTDKAKFSSGWDGSYYGQGYKQAEQDLMEKAKQWFTDNLPSEKVQLLWCEFEQFITH